MGAKQQDTELHHCKFEVPEIIFGRGMLSQVGSCARRLGGRKVFLVSDQGLFKSGWVDRVMVSLMDAGMQFVYFDQITSNPKDFEVEEGAKEYVKQGADVIVGSLPGMPDLSPLEQEQLARLEAMTPAERWDYWKEQFTRCIRCLACRQVCPFCYCEQCLCDRNRPQSVDTSPRPAGNMGWHIVRAMHLAGRCAGCAECERVCPMDIPLNLLNRKMALELKELYHYEAGLTPQEKGPLTSYDEKDDQSFIK